MSLGIGEEERKTNKGTCEVIQEAGGDATSSERQGGWDQKEAY